MSRNNRPYYTIICRIGEYDFSSNLMKVDIINGIGNPYSTVILTLIVDSKLITRHGIFGKDDIVLTIELMAEGITPTETIEMSLINIKQSLPLPIKDAGDKNSYNEEDNIMILTTVPKKPCIQMNTVVNKIFDESKLMTPVSMIEDIASGFLSNMDTDIKKDGENTEPPYQFIVPPMSFMSAIKFIDGSDEEIRKTYGPGLGLYMGPMFFTNRIEEGDKNKLCIWNLNKIIDKKPEYTVHQLALGSDSKIFESAGREPDKFYTYNDIKSIYRGNQDSLTYGYKKKFLSKPVDSLYEWIDLDIDNVLPKSTSTGNMLIHDDIKEIYRYHTIGEVGLEYEKTPYISRYSRNISSCFEIEFHLDRNLALLLLSRVGMLETVPESLDYTELGGKYIASASKISLTREIDSWIARVSNRAFRSNIK